MSAGRPRNVYLSAHHNDVLDLISEKRGIPIAEVVGRALDLLEDSSPDLERALLQRRLAGLEKETEAVRGELAVLETKSPVDLFPPGPMADGPPSTRSKSPHELFQHFVTRLGSPGPLGQAAARKVAEYLTDHPEAAEEVPPEFRDLVRGGSA